MSEVKRSPRMQKAVGVKIQVGAVGWGDGGWGQWGLISEVVWLVKQHSGGGA